MKSKLDAMIERMEHAHTFGADGYETNVNCPRCELVRWRDEVGKPMRDALQQLIDCSTTDADTCVFCRMDITKHSEGCPVDVGIAALAAWEENP